MIESTSPRSTGKTPWRKETQMRFSRSARALAIVSVMLALLMTVPAMAMAANSQAAPLAQAGKLTHRAQNHVSLDPVAPGDAEARDLRAVAFFGAGTASVGGTATRRTLAAGRWPGSDGAAIGTMVDSPVS